MLKKRIIPCLDIQNGRTVKGINFVGIQDAGDPIELAKKYGFRYKETIYRKIINKAFSSKNTPENITNHRDETMNDESIVVWEY